MNSGQELTDIDEILNQSKNELLEMISEMNKIAAKMAYQNLEKIKKGVPLDKQEIESQKQFRFQVSQLEACYRTACIKDKSNGKSQSDVGKIKELLNKAANNMGNLVGEIPKN